MPRSPFGDYFFFEKQIPGPTSPIREPNWRELWCLLARKHPEKRLKDPWCLSLLKCWEVRERAPTVNDHIDEAVLMAVSLRETDPFVSAEIEARLLAHQTVSEVASVVQWPENAIVAYEALFFEVLPLLKTSISWIQHNAVKFRPVEITKSHEYSYFWKLVAYQSGLTELERYLTPELRTLVRRYGLLGYLREESQLTREEKLRVLRILSPRDTPRHPRPQTCKLVYAAEKLRELRAQCQWLQTVCNSQP
ncbi:hypothetical protein Plim_3090 [Planctopirus limnophila DSM 3776]|uniref:Uncharacterized protein n=1 Tax=Planctopirus limnophila (strain ATCC 43296 / DSM 3776 / IFAM 1008 / Mu 290) TaxID=521674 RepID=D5SSV5_PLAL2|nr:hypothetical protein Plim_3090 [Planctopirus limnophila DSM 3776]